LLAFGVGFLADLWPSIPSDLANVLCDLGAALAFGLAAVWLLAAYLKSRFRILNVLGSILLLEAFSLLVFAFSQDWGNPGVEAVQVGIGVAASAAVIPAAVGLAGLLCRRRYRPLALCVWVLVMLLGLWVLTLSPFFLIAGSQGAVLTLSAFAEPVLIIAGTCFGVVLPFLILSFSNGFYRGRLIQILRLAPELPPD
jgi:hypothetical protein